MRHQMMAQVGPRSRSWLALGAVVLSALVLGLDSTILVTALPTLSTRLGATTDELQWISTAYLLALLLASDSLIEDEQ